MAHASGAVIRISCAHCSIRRHYLPEDLLKVFGDVEVVALDGRMRCAKCRLRDYIRANAEHPTASDRQGMKFRRLVEIRSVRRVIWRDD